MPAATDDCTRPGPVLAGDDLPLPIGDIVYHEVDGTCLRVLGYGHEEDGETLVHVERVSGPTNWSECRNLSLLHEPPAGVEGLCDDALVDLRAVLAIADEMDAFPDCPDDPRCGRQMPPLTIHEFARRIRAACGVATK